MCSSYDDGDTRPLKAETCDLLKTQCMKCKKNVPQVVIRVNDAFCRDCFLQYCTHKFRSVFGKSKVIRDGESVLVAFSGGHSSAAMLHLVMEGKSVRAQKKLRFVPGLIFVDEGAALGLSDAVRQNTCDKVKGLFIQTSYTYYMASLEQLFDGDVDDVSPADRLRSLFDSVQTVTAKEQLIKTLRQQLITQIAKSGGYSKVIVGDTSTRLSVAILSNMAQGKGAHISYDTSLLDDRDPELLIVRPMKDFTSKEVVMYNKFSNLTAEVLPTFTTKGRPGASIDKLTEAFVTGLQADFPSTVNAIMRTGDKLRNFKLEVADNENSQASCQRCLICKAPLDTAVQQSTALGSMSCTDQLARLRIAQNSATPEYATATGESGTSPLHHFRSSCYSCQQMLKDMPQPHLLLEGSAIRETNRSAMESYIAGSLLN